MAYLNRATLIGNVGKDPEIRSIQGGAKVAQFTLATTEKYVDRNGGSHENTEWHNIVAWNKSAEFAEQYVKKGSSLYVEGKIRTRSFDSNGTTKYVTEIVADRVQLLDKKEGQRPSAPAVDDLPPDDEVPF